MKIFEKTKLKGYKKKTIGCLIIYLIQHHRHIFKQNNYKSNIDKLNNCKKLFFKLVIYAGSSKQ